MNDETKEVIKEVIKQINELAPYKIVLSGGRGEYRKVVLERKIIKAAVLSDRAVYRQAGVP